MSTEEPSDDQEAKMLPEPESSDNEANHEEKNDNREDDVESAKTAEDDKLTEKDLIKNLTKKTDGKTICFDIPENFTGNNVRELFFTQDIVEDIINNLEIDECNIIKSFIKYLDHEHRHNWREIEDRALAEGNMIADNEAGYKQAITLLVNKHARDKDVKQTMMDAILENKYGFHLQNNE